jgi:cysteine desulfurase
MMDGGGHEGGLRSGTLNVPGIVGLGAAVEIAVNELPQAAPRIKSLRDRLESEICRQLDGVTINGDPRHRLNHVTNLSFADIDGESLISRLNDIAVSAGSACNSHTRQASYVLRAMGTPTNLAFASVRFSLGRPTTGEEVTRAVSNAVTAVQSLRKSKSGQPITS